MYDVDMKTDDHIDLEQRVAALEDYMRVVQEKLTGVPIDTQSIDNNTQTNRSKTSKGWISVKDGLPEEGQAVLLYNSLEYVSIVMANYYSASKFPFFDHVTLDDIHLTIRLADNMHLYWMPLPEPPKEEA